MICKEQTRFHQEMNNSESSGNLWQKKKKKREPGTLALALIHNGRKKRVDHIVDQRVCAEQN